MHAATPPADPIVVIDADDLAEADAERHLADRFPDAGWVLSSGAAARAEAIGLADAILGGAVAAAAVHQLGLPAGGPAG